MPTPLPPTYPRGASDKGLTALAVSTVVWLVFFLLLASWLAPGGDPRVLPEVPETAAFFVAGWLGLALQGGGWRDGAALGTRTVVGGIRLVIALAFFGTVAGIRALLPEFFGPMPLFPAAAGAAGGALAGWSMGPTLGPAIQRMAPRLNGDRALATLGLAFLSLYLATPLALDAAPDTHGIPLDGNAYLTGLLQRAYLLIKGAILWLPLGFIFAQRGRERAVARWTTAAAAAYVPCAAPFAAQFTLGELSEPGFALLGIWAGLWVGRGVRVAPEASRRPGDRLAPAATLQPAPTLPAARFWRGPVGPWLRLPIALVPMGLAAWILWGFPRWQAALGLGLLAYLALLLRYRHAWLLVLPALLPVLDLAPWTGRFFIDEFDMLILVTLGAQLLHGPERTATALAPRPIGVLLALFGLSCLVAAARGLLPMAPLDINALDNYLSPFNALRVGKGFLWGFVLLGLMRWTLPAGADLPRRLLTAGILAGLAGVALVGLRERWQFAGLFDFAEPYRITSGFSSMHTGGAHLPAYLALAVPFIWYAAATARRLLPAVAAGGLLLALATYLMFSTVTRAGLLALGVEILALAAFWVRLRAGGHRLAALAAGGLVLAVGLGLYAGLGGSYLQQRLSSVGQDLGTRLNHWGRSLDMRDEGLAARWLGMGLGRFPETFVFRNPDGATPALYRFARDGGNVYLELGSGDTLYLAQKVPVVAGGRYALSMDLRSTSADVTLSTPVCEKQLLDSHRCQWLSHAFKAGDTVWQHREVPFDSGSIGEGGWFERRPVEIFLYNPGTSVTLEVDNLSLRDAEGRELLHNGDFSQGGDFWFFKTHEHLAWHIKNQWVSTLFEQGWIGVTLFSLLCLALLIHLGAAAWRPRRTAPATALAALTGLLTLGLFDSPFDAPRVTALFYFVVGFGLWGTARRGGPPSHGRT